MKKSMRRREKALQKQEEMIGKTLLCLINRIEVFEDNKVYLEFRGDEEFHQMLALQDYAVSKTKG